QNRDRRLVGQCRRFACLSAVKADAVHPHRLRDVLQLTIAQIFIGKFQFSADFLVDLAGNANAARLGDSLQPRGNVDAVAEDTIIVVDDIAEIDAHAKLHPPRGVDSGIAFDHLALDGDGALDRVHHAGELGQYTVAGSVDDAS